MEAVITVIALLFVLMVVLGAYATVKAVGAARRGVDRTLTQARRTVEDHTLRARSLAQPGTAGEVARLRLALRTSMRATQDALHAGVADDESLKESLALFERLSAHGHELDGELRRLESEPDRAALTGSLPALRERTERVVQAADSLRWAARDRARRFADEDLDTLSAQIDVEAGALRHWTRVDQPERSDRPDRPDRPERSERPEWSERTEKAAGGDGERAETGKGWSGVPRPAINPTAPRPVYPWQKKARPESTT
ncbi:hypothetical protein [Streptomyces sp. CRN 30]|uniref:hypothetical protein n=1 Tax=Streptomyces sp. CRN 30 TaxID=3075613 RepID=UPI002A827DF6|nr:hypothetical protein [Streptomyces sp. CRN 30]